MSHLLSLDASWLTKADNVNATYGGALVKRNGYTQTMTGSFTGAYGANDLSRMFVVDGGSLKALTSESTSVTLKTGLSSAPMRWAEVNRQVFYCNGVDAGIIQPDNSVIPWDWPIPPNPNVSIRTGTLDAGLYQVRLVYIMQDGRKTGAGNNSDIVLAEGQAIGIDIPPAPQGWATEVFIAPANSTVYQSAGIAASAVMVWNSSPDALGADLRDSLLDPLPAGVDYIAIWKGRAYASQYFPSEDQSVIWFSQPLGFHLFDLHSDFFMVPGKALMLAPHTSALVIGTGIGIHAYDGASLVDLAGYGVVAGQHWAEDSTPSKSIYFWSVRGLCSALPFSNLTERQVSVAPGVSACGAIVQDGGQKRFIAAIQQGGTAFNPLS